MQDPKCSIVLMPPASSAKELRSELTHVPLRGLKASIHDVMCLKMELRLIKGSKGDSEEYPYFITLEEQREMIFRKRFIKSCAI